MKRFLVGLLASFVLVTAAAARGPVGDAHVADLPKEARETLALIKKGGPYPYKQDDSVFGNRERLLPQMERGAYREYTVKTPGSRNRGARRIVVAKGVTFYYTGDHYNSFQKIRE